MGVSSEAFSLDIALGRVWDSELLSAAQKHLIAACLPEDVLRPNAEQHMGELQNIVAACEVISKLSPRSGVDWLTPDGRNFPDAVYRYVFETAAEMHNAMYLSGPRAGTQCELPGNFTELLAGFVADSSSHVATLNYDGLLSQVLRSKGLLGSDTSKLSDGFRGGFFDRKHLFRSDSGSMGWYLHLHGCPLFVEDHDGRIKKINTSSLSRGRRKNVKKVGRHIVLTHVNHKQTIISSSEILRVYWEFLVRAIRESEEIIIFGYSGNDTHLNRIIAQTRENKSVRVVEWLGSGEEADRKSFWQTQFGSTVELNLLENPLGFSDW